MPIPAPYSIPQPKPQAGSAAAPPGHVESWSGLVRSTGRGQQGVAVAWPRGGLGVFVENTMDQPVTIELHGSLTQEGAKELARPAWVLVVGVGQRVLENPGMAWAPWVFPMPYCPGGLPTGGSLSISFGVGP